jgi:hypothetical protein
MTADPEYRYGVIRSWDDKSKSGTIDTAVGELAFLASTCGSWKPIVGAKVTVIVEGPRAATVMPIR